MVLFEISLNDLIGLVRMASLGKLMNGLVHNLNGPLQNLGMDMEMMLHSLTGKGHSLTGKGLSHDDLAKNMAIRLNRMEGEFEHINQLIKTTSLKADPEDDYQGYANLNEFLEEELSFLEANLYFKHHVRKEIHLEDDLAVLTNFPKGVAMSLSWFLHALTEELEKEKLENLILSAGSCDSGIEIILTIEGRNLSGKFMELLDQDISSSKPLKIENDNVITILALEVLKSEGVSVATQVEPSKSDIILVIPMHSHLS